MIRTVFAVALTLGLVNPVVADGPYAALPALAGDYFKIDSKSVGRPFHVHVRLPEPYDAAKEDAYPVVFVLDGDSLFPIIAPNHLFLTYDEGLPEAIVVGVAYGSFDPSTNRRGQDFSAPAADAGPEQGGAPAFLEFLKSELIPIVDGKYRTDPDRRILFGQSRGGYMVLYAAFVDPDLFWGYIASNPAFDPGRERFFRAPAAAARDDLSLIVTSGERDYPELREAAVSWHEHWQGRSSAPWALHFFTIADGTHASFSAASYRLGMLRRFDLR